MERAAICVNAAVAPLGRCMSMARKPGIHGTPGVGVDSGQRPAASGQPCGRSSRLDSPPPDPRSGRSFARLFRSLPALVPLLGALVLFHAAQAQAVTLVSNLGQQVGGAQTVSSSSVAQGCTTGSASGGYALSSIEIETHGGIGKLSSAQRPTIRAQLWSAAAGGRPGSKVADLTVPPTVTGGRVYVGKVVEVVAGETPSVSEGVRRR